jgi:hypothetical protein
LFKATPKKIKDLWVAENIDREMINNCYYDRFKGIFQSRSDLEL